MPDDMTLTSQQQIAACVTLVERLIRGEYDLEPPAAPMQDADGLGRLGERLATLAVTLRQRSEEQRRLDHITARINAGLLLDDVLRNLYDDFRTLIPYNRIGLALIEDDGQLVRARWAKSDQSPIKLRRGYSAPLAGSSLETIIATGQPRIINDLEDYLRRKPHSDSTRLIVAEGIRSSLTCPLYADGQPVGFLFFSSIEPHTYDHAHIDLFQRIAAQLAVIVEKGCLVSDLARQKAASDRQNAELQRLNEMKNTFLGIAAHDMRSPLGVIEMAMNFLLDPAMAATEEERQIILGDVKRQVEHMLVLIDGLLDVTQIESGRLELNIEAVDLGGFLAEAVARHARLAAAKGTRVELVDAPPGPARADPFRLRQVLDNLVSNAVKYAPAGSLVQIGAARLDSGWRVTVQDEGPGITPKDRERLFQDFARLSAQPTGGEPSTGLGLAITRRIVEAHGGEIGVESVPGQGATFWFTLPD